DRLRIAPVGVSNLDHINASTALAAGFSQVVVSSVAQDADGIVGSLARNNVGVVEDAPIGRKSASCAKNSRSFYEPCVHRVPYTRVDEPFSARNGDSCHP